MKCILVKGEEIECKDITKEEVTRIPGNSRELKYEEAILETRWGYPIKTYLFKGEKYITVTAYGYWEVQSRVSDVIMKETSTVVVEEEGKAMYDEIFTGIRGILWDFFKKDMDRILYKVNPREEEAI